LGLIEALIDVYRDGPQMKDDQGMLPIHLACRNGGSKGVVLALLNGFPDSFKVKDKKGRIPLELVLKSESQNAEAVATAIRAFEKQHSKSKTGVRMVSSTPNTPVPQAQEVDYENRTILFRLLLKKDWKGAVERATLYPEEAATWIVTKGFNGNLRFLPLHKACVLAPPGEVIDKLLEAYPDGSKCIDQDGWLPIHCACFYGACSEAITTLLQAHPKGSQLKDDEGRLPLHYACLKSASQDVVDILLETFARGSMSKDDEGRLPIHHACSKGAPEGVIDALLKVSPKGAQSKDDQGRLPLHHACRKSSPERIVRMLLRVYPRAAQIKDDQDKLPIHYSCQNGSTPNIVQLLLATFPESINVKNGFGYTPLAEANASDNSRAELIIHVLTKFKEEQDKIKKQSGENSMLEQQLQVMDKRVENLETMLSQIVNLGHELKSGVGRVRDPRVLIERIADRMIALDVSTTKSDDFYEATPVSKSRSRSRSTTTRSRSRGPFRRNKKQNDVF
jgi:ankyrin repeat protein